MKYSEHALNVLTAKCFKNIGDAWINKNISSSCMSFEIIVEKMRSKNSDVIEKIFLKKRDRLEQLINQLGDSCDGVVAVGDKNFPHIRGKVKDSERPSFIFYKGKISLLSKNEHNIAVIGLLNPDENIVKDESVIVEQLVSHGANIVSGLALGCDTVAHKQALKSNRATIAVLPSPLNSILPKENRILAKEIIENNGLLITEYLTTLKPENYREQSSRYVKRDRLQALYSDLVMLAASYTPNSIDSSSQKIDSGARHAMNKAKEYGIKRAVMYSQENKNNPKYDLNREILQSDKSAIQVDPFEVKKSIEKIFNKKPKVELLSQGELI